MPTYFKPLRRKIGVLTLVLACVLMAGWVRSLSIQDKELFNIDSLRNAIISSQGSIAWERWIGNGRHESTSIAYWSIVIPVTMLSAWLLLSKSRQKPAARKTVPLS